MPNSKPATNDITETPEPIWLRGLWMLLLFALFALAETVLIITAILQFGWMLFAKEKNKQISDFGVNLANWLAKTAKYQAGAEDEKPFPWTKWG